MVCGGYAYGWSLDSAGIIGHETGHNWGAGHCHDTSPCNNQCGACLNIAPNTKRIIEAHRDSRTCLTCGPPAQTGACCLETGQCVLKSAADCASLNGAYQGGASGARYSVEYLGVFAKAGGSLTTGAGAAIEERYLYLITAQGQTASGSTRYVQSVFATSN